MPNFRKGAEAIAKAQERTDSGDFRPFVPKIFWQKDGDDHHLLFLNPLVDIPEVWMINFIKQTRKKSDGGSFTYYEEAIARTEEGLDNPRDKDPMAEDWNATPKRTNVAVAVELEPQYTEGRGGRKKVSGFVVKTREFDRKVRDENGDATDEVETVEAPMVGFVQQSPYNFFNVVASFDSKTGPIEQIPCRIDQVGQGSETTYTMTPFEDVDLDLSALLDNLDGLSYLSKDEQDALYDEIDGLDDEKAALVVGAILLDKRMAELADDERYQELYDSITEPFKTFGNKKGKGKKADGEKRERRSRGSQRRRSETVEDDPEPGQSGAPEETPEEKADEPPKRQRRGRAKPAEDSPAAEEPSGNDEAKNRLEALRARARDRAAAK